MVLGESRCVVAKRALIFGITGQIGSFLTEHLLERDYDVYGVVRRASTINTSRIDHIYDRIKLLYGDITDDASIRRALIDVRPQEVYNLAAQSHVRVSFDEPIYTADATGMGALKLFNAVRDLGSEMPYPRIYQASSSEMFGSSPPPQNERTPFHPRSPYGCAKAFAYYAAQHYREAYGMHISNGICFNLESERRGETFVTRKITRGIARIKYGLQKTLALGNIFAKRDWTYAPDAVEAMHLMLQQDEPDDYVIGSGKSHSIKWFLGEVCKRAEIADWQEIVVRDNRYYRVTEVDALEADASKAKTKLGWQPSTTIAEWIDIMAFHDLAKAEAS